MFTEDKAVLSEDLRDIRKISCPIKPTYDAFLKNLKGRLAAMIPLLQKPLKSSQIVALSFNAEGDRYFHYGI